jgi:protease IV
VLKRLTRSVFLAALRGKDLVTRLLGRRREYNTLELSLRGAMPEGATLSLASLWQRSGFDFLTCITLLRWAREDDCVEAVVLTVADLDIGWARLQSLRRSLLALRSAKKQVWVFLTEAGMREYYLASAADSIILAPAGHLSITGIAAETVFFKGALDKLGIEAQVHQAGQYKAAGEPFTRESMSGPHREMLDGLLDDLYGQLVEDIAQARRKNLHAVRELIDQGLFMAREALGAGLVDHVAYDDEIPALLESAVKPVRVITTEDYLHARRRILRRVLLASETRKIALVTVDGTIKRGESLDGGGGRHAVGSTSFAADVKKIREDADVAALVVRVASPGGSGLASDLMWHELMRTREQKPVIISLGDVAASGGYYLALAGQKVFAENGTITGSIGVIAGKAVLRDLYAQIGVSKEILTRGRRAALFSDYQAFSPQERDRLDSEILSFYRDFLDKVATCRSLSPEAVEPSAQGRVWTGRQAWVRGLVDEIGGIEEALLEVKKRLGIPTDKPVVVERFPKPPSLWRIPKLIRAIPRRGTLSRWWTRERVWAIMPVSLRFL